MLELKDATLSVAGRTLFSRLSFMAQDGQLTCIAGPAASGKTALVEVLLGLRPLDEGLASLDGELITPLSAPVFRRLMAYVPQHREPALRPAPTTTDGLEAVWAPLPTGHYRLTPISEPVAVAPLATKAVVIADDPEPTLLSTLKSLANAGRTVVVASQRTEFINLSDKLITLGNHDTNLS